MALKIIWTPQAVKGLDVVLDYLEAKWTSKEILKLEKNIQSLLLRIGKYPNICPKTETLSNVYKGLIDKNNYIIYRVDFKNKTIEIINFRGTKQDVL